MKIETIEVMGLKGAIHGMRNPLNSWAKSDSVETNENEANYSLGENDLELAKRLCKAGSDHRKFVRMIHVQADITAPVYWIAEHDTYKISTTRNSCSFMHKGTSKMFFVEDFSKDEIDAENNETWQIVLKELNRLRDLFLETKNFTYFRAIRQLLPSGYNILYTWDATYETLRNIYHSRKSHKLVEWHIFCDWIKTLPYSELITGDL